MPLIPSQRRCIDEVNETMGTFKWSKKGTEELKKLDTDCNMTAELEAVLQVAVEQFHHLSNTKNVIYWIYCRNCNSVNKPPPPTSTSMNESCISKSQLLAGCLHNLVAQR